MKITTKLFLLAGLVFFSACKNDKKTDTSGEETTTQVEETVDDLKLAYAILEPVAVQMPLEKQNSQKKTA